MSTLCLALPAPLLPGDRSCTSQTEGNGRLLGTNMSRYSAEHRHTPEWEFFPAAELGNHGCTWGLCSLPAVQRSHPAPAGRARLGFGSSGNAFSCTRREKGKIKRWKRGELRQCETALGDEEGWVGDVGSQAWLSLPFAVVPRRAGPCTSRLRRASGLLTDSHPFVLFGHRYKKPQTGRDGSVSKGKRSRLSWQLGFWSCLRVLS